MKSPNRIRLFAEVVTVEGWHEPFSEERRRVDLHVHANFSEARLGGEPESKVRFRLRLRKADIVVVVPENEPVRVDPSSVNRKRYSASGKWTRSTKKQKQSGGKAGFKGALAFFKSDASANLEAAVEGRKKQDETLEESGTLGLMLVTPSKTEDGFYRWTIEPACNEHSLNGIAWGEDDTRRLQLVDQRRNSNMGLPPSVRVQVRCRREDLLIEGVEIKNSEDKISKRKIHRNNEAAAEAYIRDMLTRLDLEVGDMEEKFSSIVLGDVTVETS